jgi:predicted house-cleaning noncanonical NTP pyrophosphatase (MazG superfamily)
MRQFLFLALALLSIAEAACSKNPKAEPVTPAVENQKIQVALLLDTSNSMDGLIEQAKSRLWNIVNTITTLKYKGKAPVIEIALYEYGNDGLSHEKNYIRQVTTLTTDLDLISEKLFSLRTNGGSEYCGAVIQDALKNLKWNANEQDIKLVYIAGNEGFDQGGVNYKEVLSDAVKQQVFVNTIYCGNPEEGVQLFWKDGADKGSGKYFCINSNEKVVYIATPYDDKINDCNLRLNKTYIGFGREGESKKMNQEVQDKNAVSISSANYTERAVSKAKVAYDNASWDLVDNYKKDSKSIDKIKKEELPLELQNKTKEEVKEFVEVKTREREAIQKEIGELAKKRQAFLDQELKKQNTKDDIGNAIVSAILTLAKNKGYTQEN